MSAIPLRVLIVDDEAPARARLRDLLFDLAATEPTEVVGMLANGREALDFLASHKADVILLDVRMPVVDGVECARQIAEQPDGPSVVFVTAYDDYAVMAFDLAATDYLMKPVRLGRLAESLAKARRQRSAVGGTDMPAAPAGRSHITISERGRLVVVPVADVLFFRAESKYVVVTTREREYLLEEALAHLEQEFADRFLRIHRNCLVAKVAISAVEVLESANGDTQEPIREVCLRGSAHRLAVSRRLWPQLRRSLSQA